MLCSVRGPPQWFEVALHVKSLLRGFAFEAKSLRPSFMNGHFSQFYRLDKRLMDKGIIKKLESSLEKDTQASNFNNN